jgi:transposase-like protein
MAYYGIPRKRVKEHFLIARSTLYRWLHAAERGVLGEERPCQQSSRKTPAQIPKIIWDILPMSSGDWTPLAALRAGL